MKKLLVCLMVMFSMIISAQDVKTHTVQRGETIESIAQKYNVSVDEIKHANPNAGEMFYSGMKLVIPATQKKEVINSESVAPESKPKQPLIENVKSADSSLSNAQLESPTTQGKFVSGIEYFFKFNPTYDYYGLRFSVTEEKTKLIGVSAGFDCQLVKHGSYFADMGVGLFPRYNINYLLLGASIYPYIGLYSYDKIDGYYSYTGNAKYESKTEFSYGLNFDFMAGVKLFRSRGGSDYFLIGGYEVKAHEFEFEGAFKGGKWMIGLHILR